MTDFKVGDRVRAKSRTNKDEAVFTVTSILVEYDNTHMVVGMGEAVFSNALYDLELVERPVTVPDVPGLYGFTDGGGMKLLRTVTGEWYWIDFTSSGEGVFRYTKRIKRHEIRDMFADMGIVLDYAYGKSETS